MKSRGVSLVEVLLVVAAVGFLTLLLANLPNSIKLVGFSDHQSLAREVAAKSVEDIRSIPYANLANGTFSISDSRLSSLPTGSGSKVIADCAAPICTQGESAKQVTVTISWKEGGKTRNIILKTIVAEGGLK